MKKRFQNPNRNIISSHQTENEEQVSTIERDEVKTPSMYKVILLNDDYTPMDFVVFILQNFFGKDLETATKIMLDVHQHGSGIAGLYIFEMAETKAFQVIQFAKEHKHPLQCIIERDS